MRGRLWAGVSVGDVRDGGMAAGCRGESGTRLQELNCRESRLQILSGRRQAEQEKRLLAMRAAKLSVGELRGKAGKCWRLAGGGDAREGGRRGGQYREGS